MVLIVVGLAIVGLGLWRFRSSAVAADAVNVQGTVVDISTVDSATRPGRKLHAPIVEFRNPMTGQAERVAALTHHIKDPPEVGTDIAVKFNPSSSTAIIPQPLYQRLAVLTFGILVIAMGALSAAGIG